MSLPRTARNVLRAALTHSHSSTAEYARHRTHRPPLWYAGADTASWKTFVPRPAHELECHSANPLVAHGQILSCYDHCDVGQLAEICFESGHPAAMASAPLVLMAVLSFMLRHIMTRPTSPHTANTIMLYKAARRGCLGCWTRPATAAVLQGDRTWLSVTYQPEQTSRHNQQRLFNSQRFGGDGRTDRPSTGRGKNGRVGSVERKFARTRLAPTHGRRGARSACCNGATRS